MGAVASIINRRKILASVLIVVLAAASTAFIVQEYLNYANIEYYLSGVSYIKAGYALPVNLYLYDKGNVDVKPTLKVTALNATIQNITISGVSACNLSGYCWFNATTAVIGNLTASAKANTALWGIIYILPKSSVSSFAIFSNATVPFDFMHLRNTAEPRQTSQIYYSLTSSTFFMRPMP